MMHDETLNFSFSGLKTAVMREWKKFQMDSGPEAGMTNAFAHEVQESITDVLVAKTIRAVQQHNAKSILISGGVAANLRLREKFITKLSSLNPKPSFHVPPVSLCTDNAVYIAAYAFFRGEPQDWHDITALPDLSVENV